MPWPNTDGFPTWVAIVSSWCIGLKSPDAPAYFTNIVRVSAGNSSRFSSPTDSASNDTGLAVALASAAHEDPLRRAGS